MRKTFLALLALLLAGNVSAGWKFAVISDIHIGTSEDPALSIAEPLKKTIQSLVLARPDFVIIAGDLTLGQPDDKQPLEKVRAWWSNLNSALLPLRQAGIPVFPLPGNHDLYTNVERQAYGEAWKYFEAPLSSFTVLGSPPFYYAFDHKGVHFNALNIVGQYIDPEQEAWLKKDLGQAGNGGLRFVIGHVPLYSAITRSSAYFKKNMSEILAGGRVAAYICGHEHQVWDQKLKTGGRAFRQIIVGSAMADPYNYPVRHALYDSNCRACDGVCRMPYNGRHFLTDKKSRLQKARRTFYMFEVDPKLDGGYSAEPYALGINGEILPFYEPDGNGRLAPCPRR